VIGGDRRKILERIGAYVAGELSGEEARRIERFVLEDAEGQRLAESYTRLLAFLSAVGQESPAPPQAIAEHVVRWAAADTRGCTSQDRRRTQQRWDKNMQERNADKVTSAKEHEPEKDLGLVWINCPHKEGIALVGEALRKRACVYVGKQPPEGETPSSVVFCPNSEDVALGVRRLRALAPDVPILVFGLRVDPQLARRALLAGARGFIYLGMQPAQVFRAIFAAFRGKTIVSRELLETFLVEMEPRAELINLAPRQREILELLAAAATSRGEIVTSRELLEAFLMEVAIA